jgi:hypothetical protein
MNMNVLTVPRKFLRNDDLVLIPRKMYESLVKKIDIEEQKDWLYEEPFLSELKTRVKILKREQKSRNLIHWKEITKKNV